MFFKQPPKTATTFKFYFAYYRLYSTTCQILKRKLDNKLLPSNIAFLGGTRDGIFSGVVLGFFSKLTFDMNEHLKHGVKSLQSPYANNAKYWSNMVYWSSRKRPHSRKRSAILDVLGGRLQKVQMYYSWATVEGLCQC